MCKATEKPVPPRLLTEEEYRIQGEVETRKALEELREFCNSPDCSAWKTISRIQSPKRQVLGQRCHASVRMAVTLSSNRGHTSRQACIMAFVFLLPQGTIYFSFDYNTKMGRRIYSFPSERFALLSEFSFFSWEQL